MQLSLNNSQIKISLLVLIHLVGYLGIKSSFQDYFLLLTPLNLLISSFILFYGKFSKIPLLSYFYIMCFTLCLEILSVKTGFLLDTIAMKLALGLKYLEFHCLLALTGRFYYTSAAILVIN